MSISETLKSVFGRYNVRISPRVAIAAAAAVVLIFVLRFVFSQGAPRENAVQRSFREVRAIWKCESCGHEFAAEGGYEPLECPKCHKKTAYPSLLLMCPVHGRFRVLVRFKGPEQKDAYLLPGEKTWRPYRFPIPCPVCGGLTQPIPENIPEQPQRPPPQGK